MKNQELEARLRTALEHAAPNDLQGVLSRCQQQKGTVIYMKENARRRSPALRWAVAACLALFLIAGGFGIGYQVQNLSVASVVSLDVNPCVELKVNAKSRVLEANAVNEDGQIILQDMDLKNTDLNVAVNALVGALLRNGYVDELANSVLITVADDDTARAQQLQKEKGYTFIHPFDDDAVIAGQGTIGLEILDQLADVDAVLVPVGGGGLVSGVAFAIKQLRPQCKVYGVQAAAAPSMRDSVAAGEQITLDSVSTFADGIAVKHPGDITFKMVNEYVDGVVTVTEDEIAAAILALIEKQKMIAEGAGAVAVAAVMFHKVELAGKKVVALVSGGNIDVTILNRVITRGLVMSGRSATLVIALEDKPGQLQGVSEIISRCGGNVVQVYHDHADPNMAINSCYLRIGLETRDHAQVQQIRDELTAAGFKLV